MKVKGEKDNVKGSDFHCRRCGACCRIKDGIVRVSDAEIARIAAYLGVDEAEFIAKETAVIKAAGSFHEIFLYSLIFKYFGKQIDNLICL